MSTARDVIQDFDAIADPAKAAFYPKFFKAGPGEYGEGDEFLGVTVPKQRVIANKYRDLPFAELQKLLNSEYHEHRLTALIILTIQYQKGDDKRKQDVYDFYLYNARKGRVNNWDLVDTSAHKIVGAHLLIKDRSELELLYNSNELWLQRIVIISTFWFISKGDFSDSIRLAEKSLDHEHDLIHKASGWMLREIGKRDLSVLRTFLDKHAQNMPRTMLRYSIERLPPAERKKYMEAS